MSQSPSLAVTRHPPIRDQIAAILRNAIVNLDFTPGQVLVERDLCERTGASRPSVREALRQLEAEGLVESRNGRGTIVRVLTPREVDDLYEVRAQLEGFATRLFSTRATPDQRRKLHEALTELERATTSGADRSPRILAAQNIFYGTLFEGAGNPLLEQVIQGLQVRVAQLRATTLTAPGRAEQSYREFVQIVDAVDAGDEAEAERVAVEHVRNAARVMSDVVAAGPAEG
ncbi:GntR family transcriptional regulator [Agromyces sp. NPDC049794]|uniref:GntR family transcriptional regulator n=1 Tax=unclassified Agromyces TaxID=2639701 RepID=UPI0033F2A521